MGTTQAGAAIEVHRESVAPLLSYITAGPTRFEREEKHMIDPNPPVWYKGMFITPQEFQLLDQSIRYEMLRRFEISRPYSWGLTELNVDEPELARGRVQLRRCVGILSDGFLFQMPGHDALPEGRPLPAIGGKETIDVLLALPPYQLHGKNIAPKGEGDTRFYTATESLLDETNGREEKPVQVAKANFRLLLEGEPTGGAVTLPIARVRRAKGTFMLDPSFIPPCLHIGASETISGLLKEQQSLLETTLAKIADELSKAPSDFSLAAMRRHCLLQAIAATVPEWRHFARTPATSPEVLFLAMLRLAGAINVFPSGVGLHQLPDYDHGRLTERFATAHAIIDGALTGVGGDGPGYCVIRLKPESRPENLPNELASYWFADIPPDLDLRDAISYLAIASDGGDSIVQVAPYNVKLAGGRGSIDRLVGASLPGVVLIHKPSTPPGAPALVGREYFALSGDMWPEVIKSRGLFAFVPTELATHEMDLVVVYRHH
jgi:type VI secretion system protein ImpJ